jgi:hypothetical protein
MEAATEDNLPTGKCCARRHMTGAAFKTYDAIKSMCKRREDGSLIWYGAQHTLADLNNRSVQQEHEAIEWLGAEGWLICRPFEWEPGTKWQRRHNGKFTTYEFRVIEHEEYAANEDHYCPGLRYDPETGKKLTPGELADGLILRNVRRMIKADLPPDWMRVIWQSFQSSKKAPEDD